MFSTSARGYADCGRPRKPYAPTLPAIATAPEDWRALRAYLDERHLDFRLAKLNGWYPSRHAGDAHLRCVIPATSRDPDNHFWQARGIPPLEPSAKRYQSPAAARGDALVVVRPPDAPQHGAVVVEGPFDALAAAELGFVGIALLGNTPPHEVLDHAALWLRAHPPAYVVADSDASAAGAGISWRLFVQHNAPPLTVLVPYPWKDLAEMPPARRRRLLCST